MVLRIGVGDKEGEEDVKMKRRRDPEEREGRREVK